MTTAHDPVFPALDRALDATAATRAFHRALEASGHAVASLTCRIARTRLKTGRKALIGYHLSGHAADGRIIDLPAMLTLFPHADPAQLPPLTTTVLQPAPQFGPAVMDIADLGGRAWLFPNDRKIHHIGTLLAQHGGACTVLHYVPEQGCTVRVDRAGQPALFGKCRADDRGAVAAAVWSAARHSCQSIRLAPVLSYDPHTRILWQVDVGGCALHPADVFAHPVHWMPRLAAAIDAFHALPPAAGLKTLTAASIARTVTGRAERIAAMLPHLGARAVAVVRHLVAHLPAADASVLSHGDLHLANLLWDGRRFAFIDLDTAALAPPALDHASLAATLLHKGLAAGLRDADLDALLAAIPAPSAGFNWFLAACLLGERLYRCGTRLKSPEPQMQARLLDMAEKRMMMHG